MYSHNYIITYPTLSTTSAPTSTTASRRSLLQQQGKRNKMSAGMPCEVVSDGRAHTMRDMQTARHMCSWCLHSAGERAMT
jgi:hypothetical protein